MARFCTLRSGDFSGAVSDFAEDSSARGLYNQYLARLGRYPEAIERYEQVLPKPSAAGSGLRQALLEKLMEQQNQQEQAEQEQQNQQQQQSQESQAAIPMSSGARPTGKRGARIGQQPESRNNSPMRKPRSNQRRRFRAG